MNVAQFLGLLEAHPHQALRIAGDVLPSLDLPVEIEHEAGVVSQYTITAGSSNGHTLTLTTGLKHTACLAMDVCCAPAGGCC